MINAKEAYLKTKETKLEEFLFVNDSFVKNINILDALILKAIENRETRIEIQSGLNHANSQEKIVILKLKKYYNDLGYKFKFYVWNDYFLDFDQAFISIDWNQDNIFKKIYKQLFS